MFNDFSVTSEILYFLLSWLIRVNPLSTTNSLKNLIKIGYPKCKRLPLIKAFQMRFRPVLVNGKIDKECLEISKSIEKK